MVVLNELINSCIAFLSRRKHVHFPWREELTRQASFNKPMYLEIVDCDNPALCWISPIQTPFKCLWSGKAGGKFDLSLSQAIMLRLSRGLGNNTKTCYEFF
jgi:hypothetical protein